VRNPENVIYPIVAVVAWLVVARMLVAQVKSPTPQRRFIIGAVAAPGLSWLAAAPAVYQWIDRLLGVPNLAVVIVYGGVMGFPTFLAAFLMLVVRGPEYFFGRRLVIWAAIYLLALAVMVALFRTADVDVEAEGSTGFDKMYAGQPDVAWFLMIFQGYFALGVSATSPFWWQLSRKTDDRWMRRGLPLITVGSLVLLGYAIPKIVYVVLRQNGIDADGINTWAPLAAFVAAILSITGFSLCALGPVSAYRRRRLAYQAIHPLWQTILRPFPDLVLTGMEGPHDPRLAILPQRLKTLLYRRIMEIRDARLRLKPYFAARVAEQARQQAQVAQLPPMDADAAVEAALLAAALAALSAGQAPAPDDASPDVDAGQQWNSDGTHAAETRWWIAVAAQFQQLSPRDTVTAAEPA